MSELINIDSALDQINKRFGKGSVLNGEETIEVERVSTGSLGLDLATGGGWGLGRIVELFGPESAGKTSLCIHAMVEAQKAFPTKRVAFVDVEHAFDKIYARKLGLDLDRLIISQPDSGEEALEITDILISSGGISICVVDSVASLTPKAELEGEMEDNQMGLQARLMSKALRKLKATVNNNKTVLIFTNQLRDKIGVMFGNPETTAGGNALKYYASIRVDMRKKQGEKVDGEVVTSHVTCKVLKNKLAPPFRNCEFEIRFGEGVDRLGEIVTLAINCGIIKVSGSWLSYCETKLGQGAIKAKEFLKENEEVRKEIEDNVKEAYNF
jgi:recombination protein RecA